MTFKLVPAEDIKQHYPFHPSARYEAHCPLPDDDKPDLVGITHVVNARQKEREWQARRKTKKS